MQNDCAPPHLRSFLEDYQQYLRQAAGLAPETCAERLRQAELFLEDCYPGGPLEWSRLSGSVVLDYVLQAQAQRQGVGLASLASCLRCLLRFLNVRGHVTVALDAAVPRLAHVPSAPPPPHLSQKQMQAVLAAAERKTAVGKRDYAILLCLVGSSLRGSRSEDETQDARQTAPRRPAARNLQAHRPHVSFLGDPLIMLSCAAENPNKRAPPETCST